MRKKIIAFALLLGIAPALLSGCGTTTTYTGDKLLKLPSGKPVQNRSYYESLLLKKSILNKDKTKLEETLISQPNTPIYIHSKILRVLIMPYVDNSNMLHTYQYVYFKIKRGGWLLGNYLMKSHSNRVFNPLAHVTNNQAKTAAIETYSKPVRHKRVMKKANKNGNPQLEKDFKEDFGGK